MIIAYLVLLFTSFFLILFKLIKVKNYLASYFIVSAITTSGRLLASSNYAISKSSQLYYSIIILVTIMGLFIKHNMYKYYLFIGTLILLLCTYIFDFNFQTNIYTFTLEIVVFIIIGLLKELYKRFYFYLFIILLSGVFINNVWLNIIRQNKEILYNLTNIGLYNSISCIYLIIFYIIFILFHVKFRINQ